MITSEKFDLVRYHAARNYTPGLDIESLTGFDMEAYDTGAPFIFCFSDGRFFTREDIIPGLFRHYLNEHIAVYNLKYDAGAVLYDLPPGAIIYNDKKEILRCTPGKRELWFKNYTTWITGGLKVKVEYIPHKHLRLSIGKNQWIKFWDIFQFYGTSLDRAAHTYLGERKIGMETKTFTEEYVRKNLKRIKKYCLQDTVLTGKLGNYFLDKLREFGIRATSLYSSASLSFRYFQDHGAIINIKRYWKHYRECLKHAIDSYQGGKFEVTARGTFTGYEYDIVSAYPYELSRLLNIDYARVIKSRKYEQEATYGFIRIFIQVYEDVYLPFGLLINNTRVYCIGEYYVTVTKREYEYALTLPGVKMKIISAYWLYVDTEDYPYRDTVHELFKLKSIYKGKDKMLYQLTKIMMNGFYGKAAECRLDWKGFYQAGIGFNPFYASIITANTRIRVTELQNLLKNRCLAVHTDSVITLDPIPDKYLGSELGQFEKVEQGKGVLLLCGCYQIDEAGAYKGFEPKETEESIKAREADPSLSRKYETWRDILRRHRKESRVPYTALRVESIIEATAKGHFDKVNLFQNMPKEIDLNADIKRIWKKPCMIGQDFLSGLHQSSPRIEVQTKKPEYWRKK